MVSPVKPNLSLKPDISRDEGRGASIYHVMRACTSTILQIFLSVAMLQFEALGHTHDRPPLWIDGGLRRGHP